MSLLRKLVRRFGIARTMALLTLLLLLTVSAINAVAMRANCAMYAAQTERETKFGWLIGCMVKTPSGFVPLGELRTVAE